MINTIILVCIILLGIKLPNGEYNMPSFGKLVCLSFGSLLLFLHLVMIFFVSLEFDSFKAEHDQLKIDLEHARSLTDPYERMAILQTISEHNTIIVQNQQLNKNWFMDQYIDDRVNTLQTIK